MTQRRLASVLAVLAAVYLVVSVQPIAAATVALAPASTHTTNEDFQNATTLDNVGISGGSIVFSGGSQTVDGAEDGDITEYGGETGWYSAQQSTVLDGSWSIEGQSNGATPKGIASTSGLPAYPSQGDEFRVRFQSDALGANAGLATHVRVFFATQSDSAIPNKYEVLLASDGSFWIRKTNSSGTYRLAEDSISLQSNKAYEIYVDWGADGTISVRLYEDDNGDGEFNTQVGPTLTAIDTEYTSGGIGYFVNAASTLSRSHTAWFDSFRILSNGTGSGTYIGAPHRVDRAEVGRVDFAELSHVAAHVTWQGSTDGSTWSDVASASYTTAGTKSLDLSTSTYDYWRVNVTFEATGSNPSAELASESVQFDPRPPSAAMASASPGDAAETNNESVTISVPISDPDFATAQDDNVTVDLYVDGSVVYTTTVSSNTTISYTATGLAAGNHSYHVELADEYGEIATSATNTFTVRHYAPQVDNASASPQGGQPLNDENITASVDITDRDFAEPSGDTVTAEFYVDGALAATKTVTSNGTVTFNATELGDGTHTWHVELSDEYGLTAGSATFDFEVRHYAPVFDNANAAPQDGVGKTTREVTLSIPVTDPDFGEGSGSTATIDFYVDGALVDSATISANGTVSTTVTIGTGGSHSWHANASDEYGLTAYSDANATTTAQDAFRFRVPDELRIYNESQPTQLVDNATIELRFYFDERSDNPLVINRTVQNGTVNMTGVPADEPFVVVADAPGYVQRRIFVESLYETQSLYLLPESVKYVETVFVLQDYSGLYPEEDTVLLVQRALPDNETGNVTWKTVQGDRFGATGQFTAHLRYNTRHRLVILNTETGRRQTLGPYTPVSSGEFTITVTSDGTIKLQRFTPLVTVDPGVRTLPAINTTSLSVTLDNQSEQLASWNVSVIYTNESTGTSTTLAVVNRSGPSGGEVTFDLALAGKGGGTVAVVVSYETVDGSTGTRRVEYAVAESYANEYSLLATLDAIPKLLPANDRAAFKTFVAILTAIFAAGATANKYRVSTETVGLVPVAVLSGFSVVGWVGYSLVFAAGVAWVGLAGIRRAI